MRFDEDQPYVSVEHLSRRYEPIRVRRIEHLFALLGGIVPGEDASLVEDEEEDLLGREAEEEVERVRKARVALDDVSFEAAGGSCVAVVGPARAGKSVLLRVIAGLAPPTSGRVVVHGRVAAALDSSGRLFPRTGKLGTALPIFAGLHGIPPRIARNHLEEIADFLSWPDMRKQYVSMLTNKHRRSLMITLALHVEADIVLIDSAMSYPTLIGAWQERMLEHKHDGRLLIVTGSTVDAVAWIADRVLHLEHGAIVRDEHVVPTNVPPAALRDAREDENELLEPDLVRGEL